MRKEWIGWILQLEITEQAQWEHHGVEGERAGITVKVTLKILSYPFFPVTTIIYFSLEFLSPKFDRIAEYSPSFPLSNCP